MNNTKLAIESLSMDLLRVALGYHKGSKASVKRFSQESIKRINEINKSEVKPYFSKILNKLPTILSYPNTDNIAEDALMYSILCKNYAKKFLPTCPT